MTDQWYRKLLKLCSQSGVVGPETGWIPFDNETCAFIKTHSYGEYIFDWAWADVYRQLNLSYYPKILHALPFTPVNAPKVLNTNDSREKIVENFLSKLNKPTPGYGFSSDHWLFTGQAENEILQEHGYFLQKTIQFHWENEWNNFEDFLSSLKHRKRKNILKERRQVEENGIEIRTLQGSEIDSQTMELVNDLYLTTITKKNSYAYLNSDFFKLAPQIMGDQLMIKMAYFEGKPIAMALFFSDKNTLYGRQWGVLPQYESRFRFLHFELCYYQGMDWCFENKIKTFEAGAQGEHKLLRGFRPIVISSMHRLLHPEVHSLIKRHIDQQNIRVAEEIARLTFFLPYKSKRD